MPKVVAARDHAAVFLAEVLAHVLALEPGLDVAAGLVGAALVGAAMQAGGFPGLHFLASARRWPSAAWLVGAFTREASRLASLACASPGVGSIGNWYLRLAQDRLDHAMHQQVGIAPDRAGEVRVGLVGQAEVAAVDRRVDRLLHRAQQHGVDLLRVGPLLGRLGDRLELAGLRVVGDRQAHAHRLEVAAQDFLLLGRRAFVHAEQARVLALGDEVGAADVGREHRLLDQPVRLVARARHDLLDAAVVVADDLRLGGLEVDRAALRRAA